MPACVSSTQHTCPPPPLPAACWAQVDRDEVLGALRKKLPKKLHFLVKCVEAMANAEERVRAFFSRLRPPRHAEPVAAEVAAGQTQTQVHATAGGAPGSAGSPAAAGSAFSRNNNTVGSMPTAGAAAGVEHAPAARPGVQQGAITTGLREGSIGGAAGLKTSGPAGLRPIGSYADLGGANRMDSAMGMYPMAHIAVPGTIHLNASGEGEGSKLLAVEAAVDRVDSFSRFRPPSATASRSNSFSSAQGRVPALLGLHDVEAAAAHGAIGGSFSAFSAGPSGAMRFASAPPMASAPAILDVPVHGGANTTAPGMLQPAGLHGSDSVEAVPHGMPGHT